ncbi:hypothetical protein PG993_010595 [Apiospora rasikravindrae]|uniref:AB hydrolase-1 domain-containing protein n=1 Tax=Apiospora rasikravindrae TaxID=990691 RepID=A0ABR1SPJ9_9PEZI
MSKPVVVIVPGSWQKPVAFEGLVQRLQTAGFEAIHVPLPTVGGTDLPLAGLAEDVAAVQAVLQKLAGEGKKALVVGHSSGGLVGSNAVAGQDNVVGLIYLSAFMIPKGKALLDMLGGNPLPWMDIQASDFRMLPSSDFPINPSLAIMAFLLPSSASLPARCRQISNCGLTIAELQGDRVVGVPEMIPQVAFNDLVAEEQAKWTKEMTHTSTALFATPSGHEPWASGTPCGYIFCSDDNALPFPIQQQMAAQLGPEPKIVTLKAGHCPFLSIPGQLVDAIKTLEAQLQ